MTPRKKPRMLAQSFFVMTALLGVLFGAGCQDKPAGKAFTQGIGRSDAGGTAKSIASDAKFENFKQDVTNDLLRSGWDKEAAQSVVSINAEWFGVLKKEDDQLFQNQLTTLRRLGGSKDLWALLKQRPETAGLLAGADHPELIAKALSKDRDYNIAANLFVLHPAPEDAEALAQALSRDGDLIAALNKRGLLGSETVFLFNRRGRGNDEYEQWVRQVVAERLAGNDQDLASILTFLVSQGRLIRERLATDEDFRRHFRTDLWPKLFAIVAEKKEPLTHYLWDSRIWDLLRLPEGEALVRKCGLFPADMLFGEKSYPQDLHHRVAQLLLQSDNWAVAGLDEFRGDPIFFGLIRRRLPDDCLRAAVGSLLSIKNEGKDYNQQLKKYGQMNDAGLCEEMNQYLGRDQAGIESWIPLYNVYVVSKKLTQGRDPSAGDIIWGGLDVALFWVGPLKGGRVLVNAAESEACAMRTTLTKNAMTNLEKRVGTETLDRIVKTAGAGGKERLERSLLPQSFSLGWTEAADKIGALLKTKTACDITQPLQLVFKHSKIGCNTFKRVTGMDARLFMRGDAKVVLYPVNLIPHPIAAYLQNTANQLGFGAIVESTPVRDVTQGALELARKTVDEQSIWQKHVAAWWLTNATDTRVKR